MFVKRTSSLPFSCAPTVAVPPGILRRADVVAAAAVTVTVVFTEAVTAADAVAVTLFTAIAFAPAVDVTVPADALATASVKRAFAKAESTLLRRVNAKLPVYHSSALAPLPFPQP